MTIEDRVKEALRSLQSELDWIQQAEKKLGSEQPQDESVQPLQRQQKEHSVSFFFLLFIPTRPKPHELRMTW